MNLLKFIQNNPNWKTILSLPPYCLKYDEKTINGKNYLLLKYNQIESDFTEAIVKECRGIILRLNDLKIVCYPFNKFFNYGDIKADTINFQTSKSQEKIDGSIIKMWYDEEWIISTNGKIDANEPKNTDGISFKELFLISLKNHLNNDEIKLNNFYDELNKHHNYTYIFELVHPMIRNIVRYNNPDIRHIGTRNNDTFEELNIDIGIEKPKEYHFNSIEDIVKMSKTLSLNEEGYVVVDSNWNRIKIKNPAYVAAHYLKNNGVISAKRAMDIILAGETDEFLLLFPEFTNYFNNISDIFNSFLTTVQKDIDEYKNMVFDNKKELSIYAKKTHLSDFFFKVYDGQYTYNELLQYLFDCGANKIIKQLKIKDEQRIIY